MDLKEFHRRIEDLIRLGLCPIPAVLGGKQPLNAGWQKLRITPAEIPRFFRNISNVGIILGPPSSNAIDVDIDSEQARLAADAILPPTRCVYGRKSSPASHRLYRPASPMKFEQFDLDEMLLEIRTSEVAGSGIRAHQSIVPPSIHGESAEPYEWFEMGTPTQVAPEELRKKVLLVAIASTLARVHPAFEEQFASERNDFRLIVTGMLSRYFTLSTAKEIFAASLRGAKDPKLEDRMRLVTDTFTKRHNDSNARIPGMTATEAFIARVVGQQAAERFVNWVSMAAETASTEDYRENTSANTQSQSQGLHSVDVLHFVNSRLPTQQVLLEPFLAEKTIGMIHAWRGVGKTHLMLGMAAALASGGQFLRWRAPRPVPILYIDGEMSAANLQDWLREAILNLAIQDGFFRIIASDLQEKSMPSLLTRAGQKLVEDHIGNAKELFFDNISTLFHGSGENGDEEWESAQLWLLNLRRNGVGSALAHHDGKGLKQRGTSSREDPMDWVIQLKHPKNYRPEQGLRAQISFEKARRVFGEGAAPFEVRLVSTNGVPIWQTEAMTQISPALIVKMHDEDRMTFREIGKQAGISCGWAKKLYDRAKGGG
jgi:AAA domain-containing protein/bifunctional DNA primase/polymerase-like protein